MYQHMKTEAQGSSEKQLQKRVAQTCGVSFSSVRRIVQESRECVGLQKSFSTPHKKRPRKTVTTEVDDFDKCVIRRVINDFHRSEGERPTLKRIVSVLKERIGFKGGV